MSFVQYSNNLYLSKGLTHCFSQKLKLLKNCFFLSKISLEKVFSYFLYGNKSILDKKNVNFLMIKTLISSKEDTIPLADFEMFPFLAKQFWKTFSDNFYTASRPFHKRKMSIYESSQNWNFPKGLIHGFCQKLKSLLKLFLFLPNKSWKLVWWYSI